MIGTMSAVGAKEYFAAPRLISRSVRHCVTVAAWICAADSITCRGIDHDSRRAARDTVCADFRHVVTPSLQFLEHFVGYRRFDIQFVESCRVRPERAVEV